MNQLSIFVFGLLVSLAQFALLSEGGLFSCLKKPKTSGEGTSGEGTTSRPMVERPDVPDNLQHLANLNNFLTFTDQNARTRAGEIPPESLSACVGLYMRNLNPNVRVQLREEELGLSITTTVINPCQYLDIELGNWFAQVQPGSVDSQSDSWYFTMRICKGILAQREEQFLSRAYQSYINAVI